MATPKDKLLQLTNPQQEHIINKIIESGLHPNEFTPTDSKHFHQVKHNETGFYFDFLINPADKNTMQYRYTAQNVPSRNRAFEEKYLPFEQVVDHNFAVWLTDVIIQYKRDYLQPNPWLKWLNTNDLELNFLDQSEETKISPEKKIRYLEMINSVEERVTAKKADISEEQFLTLMGEFQYLKKAVDRLVERDLKNVTANFFKDLGINVTSNVIAAFIGGATGLTPTP